MKEKLGNILLRKRLVTETQLGFCLEIQKLTRQKIGEVLRYYNLVGDEDIGRSLADQIGWKYYEGEYTPDLKLIERLGMDFWIKGNAYPAKNGETNFVFAEIDDTETTDYLLKEGYKDENFYVGVQGSIQYALSLLRQQLRESALKQNLGPQTDNLKDYFNQLLEKALARGATDIHIEPGERISQARFRIDGILYFDSVLSMELHCQLVNIIFNMAQITVSEFLRFHDARFDYKVAGHTLDVRVSCIPSIHGPTIVLRLLDRDKTIIPLTMLGYEKQHWQNICRAIASPFGITLVTGPTGSGKTTTLYSILNYLKSLETKILAIEDPVEVQLPLITQVQINEKQDISFGAATRSFLRHDPDIIFVGEIRDSDTAAEAVRASITGHKVFSTLHTNTACDAILRLMDLGIGASYLASSLNCVISQRLVRKLCRFCKKEVNLDGVNLSPGLKRYLSGENLSVYIPVGCGKCLDGYWGRTAIAEVLVVTPPVQDLIEAQDFRALKKAIYENPEYVTLARDAARLVKGGITSIEEAARIVG